MAKFATPQVEENVGCNLIPMIDIMFLMLLFFMLSADMGQRDLEEVVLPAADMVKDDPNLREAQERTTVNVHHQAPPNTVCAVTEALGVCRDDSHWFIAIRGKDYTMDTIGLQLQVEASLNLEPAPDATSGKQLSARKVMIRADQAAPYGYVQRVIEGCGLAGIYKIEVGAAKPPKA